jgi:hypothetical protein
MTKLLHEAFRKAHYERHPAIGTDATQDVSIVGRFGSVPNHVIRTNLLGCSTTGKRVTWSCYVVVACQGGPIRVIKHRTCFAGH